MPVLMEDRIVSATEARQNFFRVLQQVREGRSVTIHQPKHDRDVTMVPRDLLAEILRFILLRCSQGEHAAEWQEFVSRLQTAWHEAAETEATR